MMTMPKVVSAYDAYINGIYYDLNSANKTAQVTCLSTSKNEEAYSGNVVIPESVIYNDQNYSVISIGHFAFENCTKMTNISIGGKIESIGSQAFNNCTGLTSLVIPNSVKSIGRAAFEDCSGINTVIIGTGLTDVGEYAFYGCNKINAVEYHCKHVDSWFYSEIESVTVGKEVTSCSNIIGGKLTAIYISDLTAWCNISFQRYPQPSDYHLYLNGNEITDLVIPNNVTSISNLAFCGATNIVSVKIPHSVTSIGDNAFSYCEKLTSISIPSSVANIGESAFKGCTHLKEFVIEDGNEQLVFNEKVLSDCPLETVYIGRDVYACDKTHNAKDYPFMNNTRITDLLFGKGITKIPDYGFQNCTGISKVSIPSNILSIGSDAFNGCKKLTELIFEDGDESLSLKTYSSYSNGIFNNCPITKFYLGRNLSYNEQYKLFRRMTQLTDVTIGKTVTEIIKTLFNECGTLNIRSYAIKPPTLLSKLDVTALEVPQSCSFEYVTADYWKDIETIYTIINDKKCYPVPVFIDGSMFITINNLCENSIELKEGEQIVLKVTDPSMAKYGVVVKGTIDITEHLLNEGSLCFELSSKHVNNNIYLYSSSTPIEVSINESGTLIDKINTADIDKIEYLKIQGEINGTDLKVINKMTNLKYLDMSEAIIVKGGVPYYENYNTANNVIGDYFMKDMSNLQKLYLPNSITKIGQHAFKNCSNLRKLSIPPKVLSVDISAFGNCNKLSTLIIEDAEDAISFNSSFSSIPFSSCPIVKLHVGRNFKNSGSYYNTSSVPFRNKSFLSELSFGKNVTEIADYSFKDCVSLKTLSLPNSIISIGEYAFSGCKGLLEVHSNSLTPPTIKSTTFDNLTKSNACLYVPIGTKNAYWLAPYWDGFAKIIEENTSSSINSAIIKPSHHLHKIYGIDGKMYNESNTDLLPSGVYIINGKKIIIKTNSL